MSLQSHAHKLIVLLVQTSKTKHHLGTWRRYLYNAQELFCSCFQPEKNHNYISCSRVGVARACKRLCAVIWEAVRWQCIRFGHGTLIYLRLLYRCILICLTNKKTGVGIFVLNFIVLEQSSKVSVKLHCSRTCVCM